MPAHGCRKIAVTFNLFHKGRREMTVGKYFVAYVIRSSEAEIKEKRRQLNHQIPRTLPKNAIWALDLTTIDHRPVLGVIDHGTRACLELTRLPDKTAFTILRSLIDLIERFDRPKVLRTDNEGMFGASLFWLALKMLGVRHQRKQPRAPWQNGRMKRFLGTLEAALDLRPEGLLHENDLLSFRCWYNHARPHQHLGGRTPAEAWEGSRRRSILDQPRFFSAWDGVLAGFVP